MDAPSAFSPQAADPSRAGLAGAKGMVKHTILANPKETGLLLGVLVLVIIVLVFMLYKAKKAAKDEKDSFVRSQGVHAVTNFHTGGNQAQWGHTQLSGAISAPEGGYTAWAREPAGTQSIHLGPDADNRSLLASAGLSMDTTSGLAPLGSSCSPASQRAAEDLAAHHMLNGGESSGIPSA